MLMLTVTLPSALFAAPEGEPVPDRPADNRAPIVIMFDNFFASLVAAQRCDAPDDRTLKMFVANLIVVQNATLRHFKQQLPDKSGAELANMLNARAEALDRGLQSQIGEKGCTDIEIIRLVELFDRNARLDLTGENQQ